MHHLQVFLCHKKGSEGGFAVKAVDLRRLHLQPNAEREEKKLSREAGGEGRCGAIFGSETIKDHGKSLRIY